MSPKKLHNDQTYRLAIILGLITGGLVFIGGFILCILGLSGSVQLILEGPGLSTKLTNASPGIVFVLIGAFVMWKFKPKIVRHTAIKEEKIDSFDPSGRTYNSSYTYREEKTSQGSRLSS